MRSVQKFVNVKAGGLLKKDSPMASSGADSMEIIQKLVLETLERDSVIPDTRALSTEFTQQQVIGVLMRLESHQVRT